MEGERTADKDIDRTRTGKETVENNTAIAKDVPESSKKRKVAVVSIPKRTAPSTEEKRERKYPTSAFTNIPPLIGH